MMGWKLFYLSLGHNNGIIESVGAYVDGQDSGKTKITQLNLAV